MNTMFQGVETHRMESDLLLIESIDLFHVAKIGGLNYSFSIFAYK